MKDVLIKIAQEKKQQKDEAAGHKAVAAAGGAAAVGHKVPQRLLGYESVYHGTPTDEAAKSIRKQGLKASKAGSNIGGNDAAIHGFKAKDKIKGVYTTKSPFYAAQYAASPGDIPKMDRVIKARMPYRTKDRLHVDHVLDGMSKGKLKTPNNIGGMAFGMRDMTPAEQKQAKATLDKIRVYKTDVRSRFIEGSKDNKGRKQFATKGNMRRYLSTAEGKKRFAKGVLGASVSAGLAGYSAKKAKEAATGDKK